MIQTVLRGVPTTPSYGGQNLKSTKWLFWPFSDCFLKPGYIIKFIDLLIVHIMEPSKIAGFAYYLRYQQITGQKMAKKQVLAILTILGPFFRNDHQIKNYRSSNSTIGMCFQIFKIPHSF